jgi:tetratricopeptide (TPR) repeat protein
VHLRQFEKAVAALEKAVKLKEIYPEAYNQLGVAYVETGQYQKAVQMLKLALTQNPNSRVALYNLGAVFIRLGEFSAAAEILEKAENLRAGNLEVLVNLGFAYGRQKQWLKAIAAMEKAVKSNPQDEQANLLLCGFYLAANDRQAALVHYQTTVLSNPRLAEKLRRQIYRGKVIFVSNEEK